MLRMAGGGLESLKCQRRQDRQQGDLERQERDLAKPPRPVGESVDSPQQQSRRKRKDHDGNQQDDRQKRRSAPRVKARKSPHALDCQVVTLLKSPGGLMFRGVIAEDPANVAVEPDGSDVAHDDQRANRATDQVEENRKLGFVESGPTPPIRQAI